MIHIIDFGSKKTPQIKECVEQTEICTVFHAHEYSETNVSDADALILSGSPILLTEYNYWPLLSQFNFIKDLNIPVLGICFGHQLLGLLYGATIYRGAAIRKPVSITLLGNSALFTGFEKQFTMSEDHTEGITLPQDFTHTALSEHYQIEGMQNNFKQMFGVQFHPEVSGIQGQKLIDNFISIVNEKK
ncbi:MAG: gamma-glutamyl-gamma-aminobutyrate hydrolase family protein [Bacteroidetes bacterium]|nr:gamma-glutamyl-gamma-aminobutyrate hydrolase family protein [Bacteroidota bacterium]